MAFIPEEISDAIKAKQISNESLLDVHPSISFEEILQSLQCNSPTSNLILNAQADLKTDSENEITEQKPGILKQAQVEENDALLAKALQEEEYQTSSFDIHSKTHFSANLSANKPYVLKPVHKHPLSMMIGTKVLTNEISNNKDKPYNVMAKNKR